MTRCTQTLGACAALLFNAGLSAQAEGPAPAQTAAAAEHSPVEQAPAPAAVADPQNQAAGIARAIANYEKLLALPQDPAARARTIRRIADLQLALDETGTSSFEESNQRLRKSVSLYDTLLQDYPQDPENDRILYQQARAYQNLGEIDAAERALARLTAEHPQSTLIHEAHFRRAELLFRQDRFEEAGSEYRKVTDGAPDSPFFEAAQYKFGWTEYKQANFESALGAFMAMLHRELPSGELSERSTVLDEISAGRRDTIDDALRMVSMSFVGLGGGSAATKFFQSHPEPDFSPLLYADLSSRLLEMERFTDSADANLAFVETHPDHPLNPLFHNRAIDTLHKGGFVERVVEEKERFVRAYDATVAIWGDRPHAADTHAALRSHLEDLARHYQATAQKQRESGGAVNAPLFLQSAERYRRLLELYPAHAKAAELQLLMADAYLEAGETLVAAGEYAILSGNLANDPRAQEAAYASVQTLYRHAGEVPEADRPVALHSAIDAALRFAERFPQHAKTLPTLVRVAEDLYLLNEWPRSAAVAQRVLAATPPATEKQQLVCAGIAADAYFNLKDYPAAEAAYAVLLKLTPSKSPSRQVTLDRYATTIYKQGEAALGAGELQSAASAFLRLAADAPGSRLHAISMFDGATALIRLENWAGASAVLETFRTTFKSHELIPKVDEKLALSYENQQAYRPAAEAQYRLSKAAAPGSDAARDAAWLAVTLLDKTDDPRRAGAYAQYVRNHPEPIDRAIESRWRLSEFAHAAGDRAGQLKWLAELRDAQASAGDRGTTRTHYLAAKSSLELAKVKVDAFNALPLNHPLKKTLPKKKQALELAISSLTDAANYQVAEVTTEATYLLGTIYLNFSKSLLDSERPSRMSALEMEQYNVLLEDQAFPIEEKAIEWHEANLQRVNQGIYDTWIAQSLETLSALVPAKYSQRVQVEDNYQPDPETPQGKQLAPLIELMSSQQWAAAEAQWLAVIAEQPEDSVAYTNLGITYARSARPDLASLTFTQAVAIDPENSVAHNWLGVLAMQAGRFGEAEGAFQKALATGKHLEAAELNAGILYDKHLNRPDDAIAAYTAYQLHADSNSLVCSVWIARLRKQQGVATPLKPSGETQPTDTTGGKTKPLPDTLGENAA